MGLFSSRKKRHEEFMKSIPNADIAYLKEAYSGLDMACLLGETDQYTIIKKRAVEAELERRGYKHMLDY